MKNEIIIEGIEEDFNLIQGLEEGDVYIEGFGNFWKKIKKVAKSVAKPFVKSLSPLVGVASKLAIPTLTAINPVAGTIKIASDLFDDMSKIEKKSGKKIRLTPAFGKNAFQAGYSNGYRDAVKAYQTGKLKVSGGETVTTGEGRDGGSSRGGRKRRGRRR